MELLALRKGPEWGRYRACVDTLRGHSASTLCVDIRGDAMGTSDRRDAGAGPKAGPSELTLVEAVAILRRRWRLVLGGAAAAAVVAAVAHFVLPAKYEATALLLPPKSDSHVALSAQLAQMASILPVSILGTTSSSRYVDILESTRASDALIDRFELLDRYGTEYRADAREKLDRRADFEITKGDLIRISVRDTDPRTAADMANHYVQILGEIERELFIGSAGRERRFLEARVAEAEGELLAAQKALQEFQEEHKIIGTGHGLHATATLLGQLEAERTGREIELRVLLTSRSEASPQVQRLKEGIRGLSERIRELTETAGAGGREGGEAGEGKAQAKWLFPKASSVPELALQELALERRLAMRAKLYELLSTQRELAGISEARERSTIQVVAPVTVPDRPVFPSPKRSALAGALLAVGAGFIASLWSFYREHPFPRPGS